MRPDAIALRAMHPDRFFDPEPSVLRVARELYAETRDLPLVCPHGHVDPAILSEDRAFPEPTTLIVVPDHYIIRMLYSQGVPMEALGIPTRDGTPVERDPRKIWRAFASYYYLFRGTPTGAWLDHELAEVLDVRTRLNGETADVVYDEISEKLQSSEFRPRALFERFRIEVLATTDGATDTLAHHRAIRESGWPGRVIPTFRPDALFKVASPTWRDELAALEQSIDAPIGDYAAFARALGRR